MANSEAKDKLRERVKTLVNSRWETNKTLLEALGKLVVVDQTEKMNTQVTGGFSNCEELIKNVDTIERSWRNLRSAVKANSELVKSVEISRENDLTGYLGDLLSNKQQLKDELKTLDLFSREFQFTDAEYRHVFEASARDEDFQKIIKKIDSMRKAFGSITDQSYMSIQKKIVSQMEYLREKVLDKISESLRKQMETTDIDVLLDRSATKASVEIIKHDSLRFKTALLGYISRRRSHVSACFYREFTSNPHYRNSLLKAQTDPVINVEAFINFAVKHSDEEFTLGIQSLRRLDIGPDAEDVARETCSSVMESVAQQFKQHFEKLFAINNSPLVLWITLTLFGHYLPSLYSNLNHSCLLLRHILDIRVTSVNLFRSHTQKYAKHLSQLAEEISGSLHPPVSFSEAIDLIKNVLAFNLPQFEFEGEVLGLRKNLVSSITTALQTACQLSASTLPRGNTDVFLINCLLALLELANASNIDQLQEKLESQISAHVDALVAEQSRYVFDSLNLTTLYRTIQAVAQQPEEKRASKPNFEASDFAMDRLHLAISEFDGYLTGYKALTLPQLLLLRDFPTRTEVQERAKAVTQEAFHSIRDFLKSEPAVLSLIHI